ncbi:hypothetical protein LXT21_15720 [Myxococcus sp. K38C18041901]|nr:hypothetical protein [Myxococcus guangdongensis]MCP3060232.1 hypothetical protein [Myxococcus guangdongensis]
MATSRANASRMGSISAEWKAWDTRKSEPRLPCLSNSPRQSRTAPSRPEMTTLRGPLSAAMETCPAYRGSSASTINGSADTVAIAPPEGSDCISRARAAMSWSPSSNVKTPATHAATSSPTECPITKSGTMPHAIHTRASAYSSANNAGCVKPVASSRARADSSRSDGYSSPRSD